MTDHRLNKDELIGKAIVFATEAHKDQFRKFTDEAYVFHPIEVGMLLSEYIDDADAIAAAILHDTVEDTPVTEQDIIDEFGPRVAKLVMEVSKVTEKSDGNRAYRKSVDHAHFANASPLGQSIKLADVISNTSDVVNLNPSFAKVYVPEQEALVASLTEGNEDLKMLAEYVVACAKEKLENL